MNIIETKTDKNLTIALSGRLDAASAPELQELLLRTLEESGDVLLDLAGLVYISSAGLRVLLTGQKAAMKKGSVMRVCNVSGDIIEVFKMTGFDKMLTIV